MNKRRDLKVRALLETWRAELDRPVLKAPELKTVMDGHRRNLRRVHDLTHFPMALVNGLTLVTRVTGDVYQEIREEYKAKDGEPSRDEFKERVTKALLEAADERDRLLKDPGSELREEEERYSTPIGILSRTVS